MKVLGVVAALIFPNLGLAIDVPMDLIMEKLNETQGQTPKFSGISGEDQTQPTSVDSGQYIVGTGDEFLVHVVELPSTEFVGTVDANGILFIKQFGEILLKKVPLKNAYQILRERISKALKGKGHVVVALRRPKSPTINVIGPLQNAGRLQLKGTDRIFDAIKAANGGSLPGISLIDLTQVGVRNGDSTRFFNLLAFMKTKETRLNPYVYPGDEILLSEPKRSVFVAGKIVWPNEHSLPIQEGETLKSFIDNLVLNSLADTNTVFVRRMGGILHKVSMDSSSSFILEANDLVVIPSKESDNKIDTVVVFDEVKRPGILPIQSGKTTAAEILELAGGPTDEGDVGRAYLIRRSKILAKAQGGTAGAFPIGMSSVNTGSVRPEVKSAQENMGNSNDFAVIRFGSHPESVVLEEGDEIHLPRKEKYVYLSGQVHRPGAYVFESGKSVIDFIQMAGGYSRQADPSNTFLVTRYQDAYQVKDIHELVVGDIIVVPTSVEYKTLNSVFLPVTQVVISVLSLLLSVAVLTGVKL